MRLVTIFLLSILASVLSAQGSVRDFDLGGSAYILNEECIRLTPDIQYMSGSAWHREPIDLSKGFEMLICLVLGEKNLLGADGIVFVFHPSKLTGYRGEGMGFGGLVPSLGIEFDTYQNAHLGDPSADHLSIMPNGRMHQVQSLLGPVLLPNLEDGAKHPLRILWDPELQQLEIQLDGEQRALYEGDIVNEIFGGNSIVYWGATAATGRKSNFQDVCIKRLIYAIED
ncbi:MAG: L-type lectin-domain containing protein [Bacteroidota bacterium]